MFSFLLGDEWTRIFMSCVMLLHLKNGYWDIENGWNSRDNLEMTVKGKDCMWHCRRYHAWYEKPEYMCCKRRGKDKKEKKLGQKLRKLYVVSVA